MSSIIKVGRSFPNLLEDYSEEKIPDYLSKLDLEIEKIEDFDEKLLEEDLEFFKNFNNLEGSKKALIIVLQGRDSAGKTSTGSHLLRISPKKIDYIHTNVPSEQELKHGYLWRFGKYDRFCAMGEGRVFDRSWAERVLAEKVLKITPSEQIQDSYAELRMFEWLLLRQNYIIVKIWYEISLEEQLKRFKKRHAKAPWKFSDADEVSRLHWNEYTSAANELFYRNGTEDSPWHIINATSWEFKMLITMKIINETLSKSLEE